MTFHDLHEYCSAKPGVEETFPFGEDVLVFKVAGKMFALTNLSTLPLTVNLKCDPERAVQLRERYAAVQPGYHMNKTHWNTVEIDGSIDSGEIFGWIDDSYDLVVRSLKRADREALQSISETRGREGP
ncbi:MAG TPA: MmcQ/YjbR family DNA-binding protein [Longimicrobiaceae bacterium]|nr:MmcQ/YjbR family DNA-binding protein [Longimicrobiaceae bacterium]